MSTTGVVGSLGWLAASCVAAFGGFTALALAMDRHFEDLFGRGKTLSGTRRNGLRAAGAAALVLSLQASLASHGSAQGWVVWLGILTAAALAVVLLLSYGLRKKK